MYDHERLERMMGKGAIGGTRYLLVQNGTWYLVPVTKLEPSKNTSDHLQPSYTSPTIILSPLERN